MHVSNLIIRNFKQFMKTITIFGCGWLGKQVASYLLDRDYMVYGSYRNETTHQELLSLGIIPFKYVASKDYLEIDQTVLKSTDLVIIALPPIKSANIEDYAISLQNIVLQFKDSTPVIFTSSIGIYPQLDGEFDENFEFSSKEKLNHLYLAEKGLKAILENRLTILRLGGLIGPGRHPVKYISGRKIENDGSCPVSLIDSRDIVMIIENIIQKCIFGETFNVVYPTNLTKCEYYLLMSNGIGILPPTYSAQKDLKRLVVSSKLKNVLNFNFQYDINQWKPD